MNNLIALFCGLALLSESGLTRAGEDTGFHAGATSGSIADTGYVSVGVSRTF